MRQIVLDTETTGLEPENGHRIIEVGCVELVNRRLTGNDLHLYLNPEREIDAGAVDVHGMTLEQLADKPRFADVAQDLLTYLQDAELVIHNAPFDMGFLDHEFRRAGIEIDSIETRWRIVDTLAEARRMHPGQRNGLDALCKRYQVDNSRRELHGALLDAQLLAEVYLAMTGGQTRLVLGEIGDDGRAAAEVAGLAERLAAADRRPRVQRAGDAEIEAHRTYLRRLAESAEEGCLWEKVAESYGE
jgi:DNA polymerase-3 subunit epsilon